ncbi:MAG: hypothetical protein JWN50_796 [Parcubacteria group bacterium]|nr:hypothetical protein [Parcubacteria group bacterium]
MPTDLQFSLLIYFIVTSLPSMFIFKKMLDRFTNGEITVKVGLATAASFVNFMGVMVLMTYFLKHPLIVPA